MKEKEPTSRLQRETFEHFIHTEFAPRLRELRGPCLTQEQLISLHYTERLEEDRTEGQRHVELCGECQLALQWLDEPPPPDLETDLLNNWPDVFNRMQRRFRSHLRTGKK